MAEALPLLSRARLETGLRTFAVVVCSVGIACNSVAPSRVGLAGEWAGTTAQGAPIAFTISSDEKVTSLTVGYNFNGCTGTHTYAGLSLETATNIQCLPGPCPAAVSSYRAFAHADGSPDGPSTWVQGMFSTFPGQATGAAGFRDYPGCGTALSVVWNATRR